MKSSPRLLLFIWMFLAVLCALTALILLAGETFSSLAEFIDLISLLAVLVPVTIISLYNFTFSEGWSYYQMALGLRQFDKKLYKRALHFFKQIGQLFLLSGGAASLIAFILLSYSERSLSVDRINVGDALLPFFYGLILKLILALPLEESLKRLEESNQKK